MSQRLAIDCRQVSKRFVLDSTFTLWQLLRANGNTPCYQALSDIDLTVPAGEFVGLLGRNGAGKSTLLRTIGGIHYPDHGTIHINGELSGLYELGIGGNDHLDGAAFARRWFGLIGTAGRSMVDLLDEVREFSELGEAFRRPIRTYSSGMRARLFFAVATALAAQVYVIDEMLSVGDEYFQNKCWRRLRERLGRGASGLLATHDWTAILKLCPTCYILDHGRVIASGPTPTVVREYLGNTADTLSTGAKFAPDLPLRFTAASLAEFEAPIEIDVTAPGEVQFGASVERFLPGYGWEHVLHSAPQTVATAQGRHRIALTVPRLPLPAATYSLGLFLVLLTPDGTRLMTDIRSWTYGNALELEVTGAKSRGAVRIPMSMRIVEELEVAS